MCFTSTPRRGWLVLLWHVPLRRATANHPFTTPIPRGHPRFLQPSPQALFGGAKTAPKHALSGVPKRFQNMRCLGVRKRFQNKGFRGSGWQGDGLEKKLGGAKKLSSENDGSGALPNPSVVLKHSIYPFSDGGLAVNFRRPFF